jgi:hypothetical protein
VYNDHIPGESDEMRRREEDRAVIEQAMSTCNDERLGTLKPRWVMSWIFTWHFRAASIPHGIGSPIARAAASSAAVWLGGAALGLVAVLLAYVGVVLVAALKADTPELQRYRSGLLRELLRFIRDICRGGKKR